MTHKCPKDGCGVDMPEHLLACRRHWYSIPRPVRDEINYAWKQFEKAQQNDQEVFRLARKRYIAARKTAIECLNAA